MRPLLPVLGLLLLAVFGRAQEPSAAVRPVPAQQPADGTPVAGGPAAASIPAAEPTDSGPDSVPHDLRHRSRWQQRIEAIDALYPWLTPVAPTQWISLGLLLFAGLSLMCHASVKVCGAENPSAGRCMGLALWYLVSGILQIALVPRGNLASVILLLGNPALALFWMRMLFGMTRWATVVAFAVQLGQAALGFGVLSLIDAVLASTSGNP